MKEYFKTDDRRFAFKAKKALAQPIVQPIPLKKTGELEFLVRYQRLFRLDDDIFLCANVDEYGKGSSDNQRYALAMLNIKDHTLKGIDLKRSSPAAFRLAFCEFKGKREAFISFNDEPKIFIIKDLSITEVLASYTLYTSDNAYLSVGYNGVVEGTYVFDGERLSYGGSYAGEFNKIPQKGYIGMIISGIAGDSDVSRTRNGVFGEMDTLTFDGKKISVKDGELYVSYIFEDNVIEIKE